MTDHSLLLGVAAVVHRVRRPAGDERSRLAVVLVGVLAFTLSVTLPDLLFPTASMWFHIAGVAVLTTTIVVAAVRGIALSRSPCATTSARS